MLQSIGFLLILGCFQKLSCITVDQHKRRFMVSHYFVKLDRSPCRAASLDGCSPDIIVVPRVSISSNSIGQNSTSGHGFLNHHLVMMLNASNSLCSVQRDFKNPIFFKKVHHQQISWALLGAHVRLYNPNYRKR